MNPLLLGFRGANIENKDQKRLFTKSLALWLSDRQSMFFLMIASVIPTKALPEVRTTSTYTMSYPIENNRELRLLSLITYTHTHTLFLGTVVTVVHCI